MPPDEEKSPDDLKSKIKDWLKPVDPQKKKDSSLPPKTNFSIWYFLIAFLLFSMIQTYLVAPRMETIPYSDFKKLLGEGEVKNLVIGPEKITGTLKEKAGARLAQKAEQKSEKPGEAAAAAPQEFVTIRVEDPGLIKELDEKNISYRGQYESKFLSSILAWVIPIGIFILIWRFAMRRMGPGYGVMSFSKSKAKLFAQNGAKVTFADVAGIDEAKEELQEVVDFLKNPGKFQKLGGRIPKGVLLVGPPGTGKTLLARAVAGEAGVPFFSISGSEFVEMFVGVGAARVRDLFSQATSSAPCIIFIDELDALGKARGINVMGGHDEREQTLNQLLVEMDGFESNKGVIIMAATNRPEILDAALLRPGRFDRQVLIDRPDINGREAILKIHSRTVTLAPEMDLHKIAARTPGFVGADLANLVNEAALLAARKNKDAVGTAEFDEAIDRVTAGLEKKKRVMNPKEREIVAYHESGHAIVAECVENTDPVHKITIIPRGIAALGYTQQQPTEDRYLMTRSELLDRLAVLLGGRVAEELVFGEISTGAQNDLQRATEIARSMVTEYGMNERMGLVTYEKERRTLYLPDSMPGAKHYSEEKAAEIDQEVSKSIAETHRRVQEILTGRRETLVTIAKLLLEKEVVQGEELRTLLGPCKSGPSSPSAKTPGRVLAPDQAPA